MTNRYYTPDNTKWIRQLRITENVSDDPTKRVMDFVYDAEAHPAVATAAKGYAAAFEALKDTRALKAGAKAAGRYTDLGVTEVVSEHLLTDALPKLRRAKASVDRAWSELETRKAQFVPAAPSSTDLLGEMQRSEIRKMLREMEPGKRNEYLQKNAGDPAIVAAVIHAPPALSGVEPAIHAHMRDRQIEAEHGDAIQEIIDRAEALQLADSVIQKARSQLMEDVGLQKEIFEQIASVAEANNGELPFRIEQQASPTGPVEVAKVYDMQTKQWRVANADEIRNSLAA